MFGWQPVRGIDKFGSVPAKCNKKLKRAICEYFGKSSQLLVISVEIRRFYYRIDTVNNCRVSGPTIACRVSGLHITMIGKS